MQDGSGFPYAHVFVVDTNTDRWVAGTPIRVRLEREGASVSEARAEAGDRLRDAVDADFQPAEALTSGAFAPRRGGDGPDPARLRPHRSGQSAR